jgi:hypothetical protein
MNSKWIFFLGFLLLQSCSEEEVNNNKDLEQNMMDLKIYQENLGEQVKAKNLSDASWFLEGMDSILLILNKRFDQHHKLTDPFSYFYKRRMKEPIKGIRDAIKENDTAKVLRSYRILIKNCNNCHIDNDVDKEVRF